ncbi:MAG TPA: ABC transporter substrate-binding protein [Microbacteriaceae bacterium]|jgi:peptide/nickel transport system substrate-binding protein|nr:ABC transporter substrate-binding protein [Microbacteriaceae bacterium]
MNRRLAILAAMAIASAVILSGCSGGGHAEKTSDPTTLTLGVATAPVSLDPLKAATGSPNRWYQDPAYAALLTTSSDDKLEAGLATKWGYVGTDNKTFEVTLRPNLKFSDGTELTATQVVNSLDYFRDKSSGPAQAYFLDMTFTAESADKIVISSKTPNPMIGRLLTHDFYAAGPISPAGIADPKATAAKTFGAGPYVLDTAKTVAGDHYVYTPNKYFYDQKQIKYSKITIKVIPEMTQLIQALKTGQVDVVAADSSVAGGTLPANLKQITKPASWQGLYLLDRDGTNVPALKSKLVRQALNMAVDRAAITKAAYGEYGSATAEPTIKGSPDYGYDPDLVDAYPYNPKKAKQLLTQAGYPDGFTLSVFYQSFAAADSKMIQAVANQLGKIGVTVSLKPDANFADWVNDLVGGKFGATVLGTGGPLYLTAAFGFMPTGVMNPYKVTDPDVVQAYGALGAATGDQIGEKAKALTKVLVDNAVAMPIATTDAIYTFNTKVKGVQFIGDTADLTSVVDWSPAH